MTKDTLFNKLEVITILMLSGVFMILINADIFIRFLSGEDSDSYNYFYEKLSEIIQVPLTWLSEHLLTASVTTFILWAIIGLICYSILYFFLDIKHELSETLNEDKIYVHPNGQKTGQYKALILKNTSVVLLTIIALLVLIIFAFKYFLPFSSTNILLSLYDSSGILQSILYVLMAYSAIILIPITGLTITRVSRNIRSKLTS